MHTKRFIVLSLLGAALWATPTLSAQEAGQGPQGRQDMQQLLQSPEKMARHQAKAMQKAVALDETQYDKIYKLYLKAENTRRKQMMNQSGGGQMPQGGPGMGGPGGGMGGPGGGMGGPGGGGMGGPGGGPGMGGGQMGGPQGGGRPMMSQNDAKTQEKARQKMEKKIKKILTAEQYEKWSSQQPAPGQGMPPMQPGEGMPPREGMQPGEGMPPMQEGVPPTQETVNE